MSATPVMFGTRSVVALAVGASFSMFLPGCGGGASSTITTTTTTAASVMPSKTTSKKASTTSSPKTDDQSVADDVNALFHQNDTGVIMHVLDLTEDSRNPWLACLSESDDCRSWKPYGRLSFLIMNQLSWNEAAKAINTFGDLSSVGYIGTEEVTRDLVRCIFPGDGGTMQRSHEGCGVHCDPPRVMQSAGLGLVYSQRTVGWRLHHEARRIAGDAGPIQEWRISVQRGSRRWRGSGTGLLARVCGPSSCPLGRDRLATSPAIATRPSQRGIPDLRRCTVAKRFSPSTRATRKSLFAPFQQEESTTTTTAASVMSSTTTTKKASTTSSPKTDDQSVADDVNALFHQNDTGVIMHVLDLTEDSRQTLGWLVSPSLMIVAVGNPTVDCLSQS